MPQSSACEAALHFHSRPYEFAGNSELMDVRQLSQKIQLNFVMT